jgi:hypothetical protein
MRSNLKPYEFPTSFDQQIEAARREVEKQEATITVLTSEGHETTDASRYLIKLLTTLDTLLQLKIEAR